MKIEDCFRALLDATVKAKVELDHSRNGHTKTLQELTDARYELDKARERIQQLEQELKGDVA